MRAAVFHHRGLLRSGYGGFNSILLGLEGNIGVAAYGVIANLAMVALSVYTGLRRARSRFSAGITGRAEPLMEDVFLHMRPLPFWRCPPSFTAASFLPLRRSRAFLTASKMRFCRSFPCRECGCILSPARLPESPWRSPLISPPWGARGPRSCFLP